MKKPFPSDRNVIAVTPVPDLAEPVAAKSLVPSAKRHHQGVNGRQTASRGGPVILRDKPQSHERELWAAVISQALGDAIGDFRGTAQPKERARIQQEAIKWFRDNSRDFREVCILADVDPDAVRERALKLIEKAPVFVPPPPRVDRRRRPAPRRPMSPFMRRALTTTALTPIARTA